jgi:hypothetical protein
MITFSVMKEQNGWSIRMGEWSMTPFWSKDLAIREANCLAEAIRRNGECTEVIIDGTDPNGATNICGTTPNLSERD